MKRRTLYKWVCYFGAFAFYVTAIFTQTSRKTFLINMIVGTIFLVTGLLVQYIFNFREDEKNEDIRDSGDRKV